MSNLEKIFNYNNNQVRTVLINDKPWFVAKDVCEIVELTNPTMALENLDDDERTKYYLGRQGEVNVINESGLYSLIMRSRKPEARQFKRWITHEVLPSIRKTGQYVTKPNLVQNYIEMSEEDKAIAYFTAEKEKKAVIQQLEEAKPKLEYTSR